MKRRKMEEDSDLRNERAPLTIASKLFWSIFHSYGEIRAFLLGCRPVHLRALAEALIRRHNGLEPQNRHDVRNLIPQSLQRCQHACIVSIRATERFGKTFDKYGLYGLSAALKRMRRGPKSELTDLGGVRQGHELSDELCCYGIVDLKVAIEEYKEEYIRMFCSAQAPFPETPYLSMKGLRDDFSTLWNYRRGSFLFDLRDVEQEEVVKLFVMLIVLYATIYERWPSGVDAEEHLAPSPYRPIAQPFSRDELRITQLVAQRIRTTPWQLLEAQLSEERVAADEVEGPLKPYFIDKLRRERSPDSRRSTRRTSLRSGVPGVFVRPTSYGLEGEPPLQEAVEAFSNSIPSFRDRVLPSGGTLVFELINPLHSGPIAGTLLRPRPQVGSDIEQLAAEVLERVNAPKRPAGTSVDDLAQVYPTSTEELARGTSAERQEIKRLPPYSVFLPFEARLWNYEEEASILTYIPGLSPFDDISKALYSPIESALVCMMPLFTAAVSEPALQGDPAFCTLKKEDDSPDQPEDWFTYSLDGLGARVEQAAAQAVQEEGGGNTQVKVRAAVLQALDEARVYAGTQPGPYEYRLRRTQPLDLMDHQIVLKLEHIDVGCSSHIPPTEEEDLTGIVRTAIDTTGFCAIGYHYFDFRNVKSVEHRFSVRLDGTKIMNDVFKPGFSHYASLYGFSRGRNKERQDLGSASVDRDYPSLVFANAYLRPEPAYHLEDPSRPGSVRRLEFRIVDPATPLISSRRVVPPQVSWLRDATKPLCKDPASRLFRLPVELLEYIFELLDTLLYETEHICPGRSECRKAPLLGFCNEGTFLASTRYLEERSAKQAAKREEDVIHIKSRDWDLVTYGEGTFVVP